MAIFLRGMDGAEITRWTAAMVDSGRRFDFTDLGLPLVDKHFHRRWATKITIPLIPVVLACGAAVPQAAGRGHTGGTLDKLESIAGFTRSSPNPGSANSCARWARQFSPRATWLRPIARSRAARRHRNHRSLPLIASSVMSKKLAEGPVLVLDVKAGGAFLATEAESRELAAVMVALGNACGCRPGAAHRHEPPAGVHGRQFCRGRSSRWTCWPADKAGRRRGLTLALAPRCSTPRALDAVDPACTLRAGTAMDRFRRLIAARGGDLTCPLPIGACTETGQRRRPPA